MAIAMAQPKGSYVYDKKNSQLFTENGELHGYKSGSVTIKKGNYLYTYDEKHRNTSTRAC